MRGIKVSGRVACVVAATLFLQNQIALAGETMRIGGTGGINGMVKNLAPLFAAETGITLELIPSLGAGGGNNAVADGVLDVSISGRPLNAAEIAKGLTAVAEFRTPFGLVTSHPKPNGFKSAEFAQLYQSDKPIWDDGTPIRIVLRPTNDSDTWLLGQILPGMAAAIAKIRPRADITTAATDQDNADMAEQLPGSLVGASLTQIKMEKRNLRFVAIDGVEPTLDNYKNGTYPLGKPLYVVLASKKSSTGERFLAFLRTPKGVAALQETGVVPGAQ
jgi:phosphate transport system substrate-binding protein